MGLFTNINWRAQVSNILPPVMRSGSILDLLAALTSPLKTNSDAFATFEENTVEAARYNSQKMVLQAGLNNIFSVVSPPFIIVRTNSILLGVGYIFEQGNANVTYIHEQGGSTGNQLYIFESTFIGDDFNFVVKIPMGIYSVELERQIRAQVNKYRLTGKTFTVIQY